MTKKYTELGKTQQLEIELDLESTAKRIIGKDPWENQFSCGVKISNLGLCSNCENLQAARSRYGSRFIKCYEFDFILKEGDPIEECTHYKRNREMTLSMMTRIATIIEIKKGKVGF